MHHQSLGPNIKGASEALALRESAKAIQQIVVPGKHACPGRIGREVHACVRVKNVQFLPMISLFVGIVRDDDAREIECRQDKVGPHLAGAVDEHQIKWRVLLGDADVERQVRLDRDLMGRASRAESRQLTGEDRIVFDRNQSRRVPKK